MGAAATGVGFIFVIFFALIGFILFIGFWRYRRHYLYRLKKQSAITLFFLNIMMIMTISPMVMLLFSIVTIQIEGYFTEKSRLETDKNRFIQLSSALPFGEIIIPKHSWINTDGATNYPAKDFTDIRQGLYRARFSEPIEIASLPAAAFEATYRGILIELAESYTYEIGTKEETCAKGWIARLLYPEKTDREAFYQDQTGSWFTPSKWQIDRCFQTTGGIAVIAINPEFGVFVLDSTPYND